MGTRRVFNSFSLRVSSLSLKYSSDKSAEVIDSNSMLTLTGNLKCNCYSYDNDAKLLKTFNNNLFARLLEVTSSLRLLSVASIGRRIIRASLLQNFQIFSKVRVSIFQVREIVSWKIVTRTFE